MANQHCSVGPINNVNEFHEVYYFLGDKELLFQNPSNIDTFPCYLFIGNVSFIAQRKPSNIVISIEELFIDKRKIKRKLVLNNGMPKDIIPMLDRD